MCMKFRWVRNTLTGVRLKLQCMPFFGHLLRCRPTDYWNASVEYSHALVWSTMPFWLGALVIYVQESTGNKEILEVLTGTFKNGELLVYTISTLTPITYFTLFEDPDRRFPHRLGIGTIAIILIISSASLFALQKGQVQIKQPDLFTLSLFLSGTAIVWRYIAVLYNRTKVPVIAERDFTENSERFMADLDDAIDGPGVDKTQDDFLATFNAASEPAHVQNGNVGQIGNDRDRD